MFQEHPILQQALVSPPWTLPNGRRLPGLGPVESHDWYRVDDAYAAQMDLRGKLISGNLGKVHALLPSARNAAG